MKILRAIKEFFKPSLKCKRTEHKYRIMPLTIRKRSTKRDYVVTDWNALRFHCKRCGYNTTPTMKTIAANYTGCSMPKSMWDEMDKNGFVIMNN